MYILSLNFLRENMVVLVRWTANTRVPEI